MLAGGRTSNLDRGCVYVNSPRRRILPRLACERMIDIASLSGSPRPRGPSSAGRLRCPQLALLAPVRYINGSLPRRPCCLWAARVSAAGGRQACRKFKSGRHHSMRPRVWMSLRQVSCDALLQARRPGDGCAANSGAIVRPGGLRGRTSTGDRDHEIAGTRFARRPAPRVIGGRTCPFGFTRSQKI
jgi:hypothetical protein